MKLLAFELATEACSVALWIDGELRERFAVAPRRHAELALPYADALLADAGIGRSALDAVAVGRGPGAFTGVRLAVSIAQGIALGLGRPAIGISTLAALALQGEGRVLAAIDARMGEVYAGAFAVAEGDARPLQAECVCAPAAVGLPDDAAHWQGVGTGFAAGEAALQRQLRDRLARVDADALPRAADVARLAAHAFARGEAVAPERLQPAYLRNQVALTLAQRAAQGIAR